MLTVLLWKNLIYDRLRFAIAVAGVTFAAFLMTIQADLLYGFTKAASRVVEATDAAIWIMPRGVPCFDYSAVMPEQIRELAYGVPGVARTGRIASGFTVLKTETGFRQAALLIGVDDEFAGGVPVPVKLTPGGIHYLESATIDATDFHLLKTPKLPSELEAGMQRLRVMHLAEGFASFLGSPYVFVSYRDAKRYLGVPEEQTMFVLVQTQPEADPVQIRDALRLRLPEFDVLLKEEFMPDLLAGADGRGWGFIVGGNLGVLHRTGSGVSDNLCRDGGAFGGVRDAEGSGCFQREGALPGSGTGRDLRDDRNGARVPGCASGCEPGKRVDHLDCGSSMDVWSGGRSPGCSMLSGCLGGCSASHRS